MPSRRMRCLSSRAMMRKSSKPMRQSYGGLLAHRRVFGCAKCITPANTSRRSRMASWTMPRN